MLNKLSSLVRRIDIRVVPLAMIAYLVYFLDRSNIGNARILNSDRGHSLMQTLKLTNTQFTNVLDVYVVSLCLVEVPSNILLKRFYPSKWLAFIIFAWGACTMIQAAASSYASLAVIRFLTGAFEGGYFPGIVYFLTFWYKPEERSLRLAMINACATLGGAFGGAIAYGVGFMDGTRGIEAWRWLSIFEGLFTCVFALLMLSFFPDYPETARWLSHSEKHLATTRISRTAPRGLSQLSWSEIRATLFDMRLYLHYLVFFGIAVPFSSFSLFVPTIVSGLGYKGLNAQLMTVPPFAAAFVFMIVVAWAADRRRAQSISHTFYDDFTDHFDHEGALSSHAFRARYTVLCLATSFTYACPPLMLNYLTTNLRGTSAMTIAIPMNIGLSLGGQIIGLYIYKPSEAPGYPTGHFTNAGFMLMCSVILVMLQVFYWQRNRKIAAGGMLWVI
ncbi:MFS transporter [Vararia minispora EC-137]|uniref:MFS transporter n=1 Tax=Vararia minispora EC-137 TaxID=1314806 RepID=A0ACB8QHQ0_9AGAM|nr:MFS transporter [Vararia minispora EC-137]